MLEEFSAIKVEAGWWIGITHAFSLPLVKSYLDTDLNVTKQEGAYYGILPENNGYIFLASMNNTDIAEEFSGIMDYLNNTKGLILDIRTRKGGTIQNVEAVVLINAQTFSAGESTTEMLKQLPNVTVIGEATGGGGGTASAHSVETTGNYELPSGIMINIPTGYGLRFDGLHFEWLGVPPDIRVEQTADDIKIGKDKQLEHAIDFLK